MSIRPENSTGVEYLECGEPHKVSKAKAKEYYQIADEYIANGYNAGLAWMKFHPRCQDMHAATNGFTRMKRNFPPIVDYIKEKRQEEWELKSIDILRIKEEVAKGAFAEKDDKDIPPAVKQKYLDLLYKILNDAEKADQFRSERKVILNLDSLGI